MTDQPDRQSTEARLREALEIAINVMEIASDWNAPDAYDIEVPSSWDSTKDPDGAEPEWPTLSGVIKKCREALA